MSFVKKIWKDRISQFPNRRTINDGYVTKPVTVGRDEGVVTEEGTPFNATEMNDLENRIYAAIEAGGGGGGGAGTFDYTELFNKPRINNHELDGNKSLGDLGIASSADELPIESGSATNTKDYIDSGLSGKVQIATFNFTKTINATTQVTYFIGRTDFNLPSNAVAVSVFLRENTANSVNAGGLVYSAYVNPTANNVVEGAIYNGTATSRTYSITATLLYTLS